MYLDIIDARNGKGVCFKDEVAMKDALWWGVTALRRFDMLLVHGLLSLFWV